MRAGFMALYGEKYFREQWSNWVEAFEAYFKKRDGKIHGLKILYFICLFTINV